MKKARQIAAGKGLHYDNYNHVKNTFDANARRTKPGDASKINCVSIQIKNGDDGIDAFSEGIAGLVINEVSRKRPRSPRKPGSRRWDRPEYEVSFRVRGPRNPLGPADLRFNCVATSQIPPNAIIKMVHLNRFKKPTINKDGILREMDRWKLTFICDVPIQAQAAGAPAGLALVWGGHTGDDPMTFAVLASGGRTREYTLPAEHHELWLRYRVLKNRAEKSGDPVDKAEADIFYRKIRGTRNLFVREFVKKIAEKHSAIAVEDLYLAHMGVKGYAAPSIVRVELQRACENAGSLFLKQKIDMHECHACGQRQKSMDGQACECGTRLIKGKNLAFLLEKCAKNAIISKSEKEKDKEKQKVAA